MENGRTVIYCKVCGSYVPRKRTYSPSICEACKKFFTRTCKRQDQSLACQSGKGDCTIDGRNRRFCTACRFQKCLAVGMKCCRLWTANSGSGSESETGNDDDSNNNNIEPVDIEGTGSSNSNNNGGNVGSTIGGRYETLPASTIEGSSMEFYIADQQQQQCDTMLMPLVNDPVLFDGTLAENMLRTAAQAVCSLHGLEFMPLRLYNGPISDILTFWNMALRQLFESTSIGFCYGRQLTEGENLPDNDINVLITAFLPAMAVVYYAIPGNKGAAFIGINDQYMPQFFSYFPGFLEANESIIELGKVFTNWNPTFPEYAVFIAFALFRLGDIDSEQLRRLRRRLLLIFNLHLSQSVGEEQTLTAQLYFKRAFKLVQKSITRLRQGIAVMSVKLAHLVQPNVLFNEVCIIQPSQTRLGELFPKPVPKLL